MVIRVENNKCPIRGNSRWKKFVANSWLIRVENNKCPIRVKKQEEKKPLYANKIYKKE